MAYPARHSIVIVYRLKTARGISSDIRRQEEGSIRITPGLLRVVQACGEVDINLLKPPTCDLLRLKSAQPAAVEEQGQEVEVEVEEPL